MPSKKLSLGLAAAVAMFVVATLMTAAPAVAQTEKVLHTFGTNSKGGIGPEDGLIFDSHGNLYGIANSGGTDGEGIVYELSPKAGGGWTEHVLYSFLKNGLDGENPAGGLIFDSAGNLYGTTSNGGPDGVGTAYELSPPVPPSTNWTEKVLYSFLNNGTDGQNPENSLVMDSAGNLYGTAAFGGKYVVGVAFELSPTGGGSWTETLMHTFHDTGGGDGADPRTGLIFDSAGNLYGSTLSGGTFGGGTVYELSPATGGTWTEAILYNFADNNVDGGMPSGGSLIFDSAGNLYGDTTGGGPTSGGTVFKLSPSSGGVWTEEILHYFNAVSGTDGIDPFGSLTFDSAGNLYGTTLTGGTGSCPGTQNECGVVYELRPSAAGLWFEKILHDFTQNGTDGYFPVGGVTPGPGGSFYGTTYYGGAFNEGTVFTVKP